MFDRFNDYLSKEFKGLPKSREVNDFKDELLGTLMEKAEELKNTGKSIQEIFELCISSINGFKDTLKAMKSKPIIKKEVASAAKTLLIFSVYLLVLVGAFLAVSFVTGRWGITWLIIVEGVFAGLIVLLLGSAGKGLSRNKTVLPRLSLLSSVAIATVGMYLGVSFWLGIWSKSWIIMLFLPVFLLLADLIIAAAMKKKYEVLGTAVALLPTAATMTYVSLAFLRIIVWHPYWLIIVGAVIIDAIIITAAVYTKFNKK